MTQSPPVIHGSIQIEAEARVSFYDLHRKTSEISDACTDITDAEASCNEEPGNVGAQQGSQGKRVLARPKEALYQSFAFIQGCRLQKEGSASHEATISKGNGHLQGIGEKLAVGVEACHRVGDVCIFVNIGEKRFQCLRREIGEVCCKNQHSQVRRTGREPVKKRFREMTSGGEHRFNASTPSFSPCSFWSDKDCPLHARTGGTGFQDTTQERLPLQGKERSERGSCHHPQG